MEGFTDGEVEMLIRAVALQVEFWRTCGDCPEQMQREQYASWMALLNKLEGE